MGFQHSQHSVGGRCPPYAAGAVSWWALLTPSISRSQSCRSGTGCLTYLLVSERLFDRVEQVLAVEEGNGTFDGRFNAHTSPPSKRARQEKNNPARGISAGLAGVDSVRIIGYRARAIKSLRHPRPSLLAGVSPSPSVWWRWFSTPLSYPPANPYHGRSPFFSQWTIRRDPRVAGCKPR